MNRLNIGIVKPFVGGSGEYNFAWKGGCKTKKVCKECRKEFISWRTENKIYCSQDCYNKNRINPMLGKHHTDETKMKISLTKKGVPQPREIMEKRIKASFKALRKRPTRLEKRMLNLIKKFNLPFSYCGDGSLIIGGKIPDFYENNGKKICLEVSDKVNKQSYGIIPEQYEKGRIGHFEKYGWKCLVIWSLELKRPEMVVSKIRRLYGFTKNNIGSVSTVHNAVPLHQR